MIALIMPQSSEWDASVVIGLLLAFSLPLTLLIPNFSIWDVIPKIRVIRFHFFFYEHTWSQLNTIIIVLLIIFFIFYLEIKRRTLDDLVESVLTASQATEKTMEAERNRQAATVRMCVDLLDNSADHYEHLVLFRDEMRRRNLGPPTIESSSLSLSSLSCSKKRYSFHNELTGTT